MLDAREIDHAISQLEYQESSWPSYDKLASLYIIRDHMEAPSHGSAIYSESASMMETYGDSDFLQAVAGKDPAAVWEILDDLMDTLHVVNPRVYDGVMRKIWNI